VSHYASIVCDITDQEALVRALAKVQLPDHAGRKQWGQNAIEFHAKAAHLIGYHGDTREQTAHVIIRRSNVGGSSNDIGFVRGADGKFSAIISEFDNGQGYNAAWLKKVIQVYGLEKSKIEFDSKGMKYEEAQDSHGDPTLRVFFEPPKKKAAVTSFFG
jgi:Protein of unknown function (DUF1257)